MDDLAVFNDFIKDAIALINDVIALINDALPTIIAVLSDIQRIFDACYGDTTLYQQGADMAHIPCGSNAPHFS